MFLKQMLKYITENFNVIVFFPWYFIFKSSESASDQIRSVTQSCPTLCDPMNHSTPGLPVHHPATCLLNMSLKKGRNQNFKAQNTQPYNRSGSDQLGEMMVSFIWASGATTSACKQERYWAEERF